jgi:hypothetical protein
VPPALVRTLAIPETNQIEWAGRLRFHRHKFHDTGVRAFLNQAGFLLQNLVIPPEPGLAGLALLLVHHRAKSLH